MLDSMKYVNHLGEEIQFGSIYYANYNDLRDYAWTYSTEFSKVVNFRRSVTEKSLPILIKCTDSTLAAAYKNAFFATTEKDIIAAKPGKFVVGDYYFRCYIYSTKKTDYLVDATYLAVTAKIVSDSAVWTKEVTTLYHYTSGSGSSAATRDYSYDYAHDYTRAGSTGASSTITNPFFAAVDFIAVISGGSGTAAPTITIGSDVHKFTYTIPSGGYVTLDTKARTLVYTSSSGATTNIFSTRDKANDIFAKIPSGVSSLSWNGTFDVQITLLIDRSEPEWT